MVRFLQTLGSNILALGAGIFLAFGTFYLVYDSDGLTADVLQKQLESDRQSDLFYTFDQNELIVSSMNKFVSNDAMTITTTIHYDSDNVAFDLEENASLYDYSFAQEENRLIAEIYVDGSVQKDQEILRISFDGPSRDITLGNTTIYVDGSLESLSIGTDNNFGQEDLEVHY